MIAARRLASVAAALTLLVGLAPARAGTVSVVVLNNLDQTSQPVASTPYVGQSFIAGAVEPLDGARMQLAIGSSPSSHITLEVEARNADGTVGSTLFSDFSYSYDPRNGVVTFLANSPFQLAAGTGYWLVLSDSTAGGVTWDFTASPVYQSNLGFGLPSYNTSFTSDQNNGMGKVAYYQPSDGPQMFALIAAVAVAEPSSPVLLGLGAAIVALAIRFRGGRRSGRSRTRIG
jgi:hypothetical protein